MVDSHRSSSPGLRLRLGGETHALDGERVVVGRSRSCQIRLREDTVSRLHAALLWYGNDLVVEDLGSSNGTFVNGERVQAPRAIQAGDLLRFGSLRGVIEAADGPVPAEEGGITVTFSTADDLAAGGRRPAGLGRRLLAVVADLLLFTLGSALPLAPLGLLVLAERHAALPGILPATGSARAVVAGTAGALWVLYSWYFLVHGWARRGGSPGMRVAGLQLLDWRCRCPIGFTRAMLRVLALLVTFLTLGLGFLIVPLRRDRRALHDLLAGTLVVRRVARRAREAESIP
ncbi:MAG: FHA domain-containing protein [Acidobacteriota bacterium]